MASTSPLDRIAMAGSLYRRPGGPAPAVPSHADIAAALLRSPVTLTRGEADEIADTLRHVLFPSTREAH